MSSLRLAFLASVILAIPTGASARPSLDHERLTQLAAYDVLVFGDPHANGIERGKAIGVEVLQHVPDRSSLVKASPATCATLMPCADHSTICARRHVTTDRTSADSRQAIKEKCRVTWADARMA